MTQDQVVPNAPELQKAPAPQTGVFSRLRGYFVAGVLVTAPLSITLYLAWAFIQFVDRRVTQFIPAPYNPENYIPFSILGLGLVIVVVTLTLIGFTTAGFLGRFLLRFSERILDRMPVIRSIYGALKQILETVLARQSDAFREVVLIEYPRKGVWCVGFLTGVTKGEIQDNTNQDMVNVFLPTTPNPTSGFLLFVPRKDIIPLSMSVEQGIKLVISAGIVTPQVIQQDPS